MFARYGDSIIACKVIREFIAQNPGKSYLLVTTPQVLPYARTVMGEGITYIAINKRKSLVTIVRLLWRLRTSPPDLAFNPWSHGRESEYLISFADRFMPYRSYARFTREVNLYDRIRKYLLLPGNKTAVLAPMLPDSVRRILISPFSTDVRKSLDVHDLKKLAVQLAARYPDAQMTVALFSEEQVKIAGLQCKRFFYGKTRRKSLDFLELLKRTDLFVSVDAGPLHLSDALGVPTIGIFGPTAPETILNYNSGVTPWRLELMRGFFCDIRECGDPVCLHQLFQFPLSEAVVTRIETQVVLETGVCRAR